VSPATRRRREAKKAPPQSPTHASRGGGRSVYATPGSPIASAVKKKKKPKVRPVHVPREVQNQEKAAITRSQHRRGSTPSIDYTDPNNKIFSPGQYHEHDTDAQAEAKQKAYEEQQALADAQARYEAKLAEQQQQDEEDQYEEFDPFLFIKSLPPLSRILPNNGKRTKFCIPAKSLRAPPISLALDLDETLVHCSIEPIPNPELTFSVSFNGVDYDVYVRTRPYLTQFLREVSQWFEVIVFTASQQVYADKLLDILDPGRKYIKYRVFRESCVYFEGNYLKDLTILGREMDKVAIIDNSVQAFGFQLNNGIPIESWFEDPEDTELLSLLPFLKALKNQTDVRPLIKKTFGLEDFIKKLPSQQ
jgi:CTD small phosphatase-like protein 2